MRLYILMQPGPPEANAGWQSDANAGQSPIKACSGTVTDCGQIWATVDYHERDALLYTYFAVEPTFKVSSEKGKRTFGHFAVGSLGLLKRLKHLYDAHR